MNDINKDFDKAFPPPPAPSLELTLTELGSTTLQCRWDTDRKKACFFVAETAPHAEPATSPGKKGQGGKKKPPPRPPGTVFSRGTSTAACVEGLAPGTEYEVKVRLFKSEVTATEEGKALAEALCLTPPMKPRSLGAVW